MPTEPKPFDAANLLHGNNLAINGRTTERARTTTFVQRRYESRKFYMVQICAMWKNPAVAAYFVGRRQSLSSTVITM